MRCLETLEPAVAWLDGGRRRHRIGLQHDLTRTLYHGEDSLGAQAHRAAVEIGSRTIAVLPSPLDRIYPPRHRELARRIVASGGALVTEIPIGAPVGRPDFARRNRLIAGLAEAVIVVEAPDRSGALLTAAAAIAIGRELYAVPGPIDAMASRGTRGMSPCRAWNQDIIYDPGLRLKDAWRAGPFVQAGLAGKQ